MYIKTILIVDDEDDIRLILKEQLSKFGFVIFEASNGVEAIEIVKLHPEIDLILTDLVMPKMTGEQLLQKLKNIPVITAVFTGKPMQKNDIIKLGVNAFLTKPFELDELNTFIKLINEGF